MGGRFVFMFSFALGVGSMIISIDSAFGAVTLPLRITCQSVKQAMSGESKINTYDDHSFRYDVETLKGHVTRFINGKRDETIQYSPEKDKFFDANTIIKTYFSKYEVFQIVVDERGISYSKTFTRGFMILESGSCKPTK